jgi:virulence factor
VTEQVRPVRVGFVGCGRFASTVHYPSLSDLPSARLVAIAELDDARRAAAGERYGIPAGARYRDHREMLAAADVEAVYVVMEPSPGAPVVIDCLRQGRHVFMEKPPGINLAVTERLADEAERAGRILQVGWNRRFAPVIRRSAELLAGATPTLVMGEFHKAHPAPEPFCGTGSWLVVDQSHALDAITFLAGGLPTSVTARCRALRGYPDCNTALLGWDAGTTGIFMSNYVSGARVERFELHCEDGAAYMEAPGSATVYRAGCEPERLEGATLAGGDAYHRTYGYLQEGDHFLASVRSGSRPETSIQHAVGVMRLAAEIERSVNA